MLCRIDPRSVQVSSNDHIYHDGRSAASQSGRPEKSEDRSARFYRVESNEWQMQKFQLQGDHS